MPPLYVATKRSNCFRHALLWYHTAHQIPLRMVRNGLPLEVVIVVSIIIGSNTAQSEIPFMATIPVH